MRKAWILVPTLCLCFGGSPPAAAEAPPKVLQIIREEVKPGKGAAHEKIEAGWPAAFHKANGAGYYIAMTAQSGPNEAWFVGAWDSLAAAEKETKAYDDNATLTAELQRLSAVDGDLLSGITTQWALYREDLSYQPDIDIAKMRYFSIQTVRLNPGHRRELVAANKLIIEMHQKAKMDEHWATYEVVSGAANGTFLIFFPMKSMVEIDAADQMHGKAYQDIVGEEGRSRISELQDAAIRSQDTALFAFSPKMSYVSKVFSDRDPEFWNPKPPAPAGAKKEEKKP